MTPKVDHYKYLNQKKSEKTFGKRNGEITNESGRVVMTDSSSGKEGCEGFECQLSTKRPRFVFSKKLGQDLTTGRNFDRRSYESDRGLGSTNPR